MYAPSHCIYARWRPTGALEPGQDASPASDLFHGEAAALMGIDIEMALGKGIGYAGRWLMG